MTSQALKDIFAAGRPVIEQELDVAEMRAALRDAATAKGLEWGAIKALLKATILDERDGSNSGKRVSKLVEKADFTTAYADMLGLAPNMNEEKNISPPHDPVTGEVLEANFVGSHPDTGPQGGLTDETGDPGEPGGIVAHETGKSPDALQLSNAAPAGVSGAEQAAGADGGLGSSDCLASAADDFDIGDIPECLKRNSGTVPGVSSLRSQSKEDATAVQASGAGSSPEYEPAHREARQTVEASNADLG